jgi:hypothetical protein
LVSDNGVQFTSHEFECFLKQCNIQHVRTSLYFPQSNGLCERFNRSLKEAVRIAVAEGMAVDVGVRNMLVTFRSTSQPATGVTPAQLMFGRQLRVPINSFAVLQSPPNRVHFDEQSISAHVDRYQQKMATQFNRRHRVCNPKLQVGDWVRVRVPNRRHKTSAAFSEPHRIIRFVAPFTVILDNNAKWHLSKLKRCDAPEEQFVEDTILEQTSDELPATVMAPPVSDDTLVFNSESASSRAQPSDPRRSSRNRVSPSWHKDYHMT